MGKTQKSIKHFHFQNIYKTVPVEKEITKIDKAGNESVVAISDKRKFIDSARFMVTSLSNLVNNLEEGIHKIKCKGL